MKITIDTQQESREHLQHLINLLQKILENRSGQGSINEPQPGVLNMFKSDESDKYGDEPEQQQEINQDKIELIPY